MIKAQRGEFWSMNYLRRQLPLMLGILVTIAGIATADSLPDPRALLAAAQPGQTVTLPAGAYTTAGLVIPHGVSLRGAGYGKTTIEVTGQIGVAVDGGGQSTISDLTVTDAVNAGILVTKSTGVAISRVRVLRCLTGVMASGSTNVRLENVVAAQNRTGMALNACAASSIANCTLAQNTALGISLGINTASAVFNCLIVNSPIGIFVAPTNTTLALDNNLYMDSSVGKCNDILEPNVFVWRDATGYDRHSLSLSVAFADDNTYVYRTTTRLSWAQDRAATSGWGAAKLGTFTAPARDIDGQPYLFGPCVGAWEVAMTPTREADGTITIHSTDGTKSAGLYTKAGKHVAWLFSNLPLKHDMYRFWLPPRVGKAAPFQLETMNSESRRQTCRSKQSVAESEATPESAQRATVWRRYPTSRSSTTARATQLSTCPGLKAEWQSGPSRIVRHRSVGISRDRHPIWALRATGMVFSMFCGKKANRPL